MKSTTSFLTFILVVVFFACNNTSPNDAPSAESSNTADTVAVPSPSNEKVMILNARFVEFSLGDAPHYIFEDKNGKMWDFGGCDDTSVSFEKELSEAEADESNQGWSSNTDLQNKWFDIKYVIRQQPQYLEGPIGDVPVIIEAVQVK